MRQVDYQVAVIGGGPGGYVAAIRAAQLGARVVIIEKDKLGGVCLNRGCIPTKTLLKSAEKWLDLQRLPEFGLRAENIGFDFAAVAARKDQVVAGLQKGIVQLVNSNRIDVMYGQGQLTGPHSVQVLQDGETAEFTAEKMILATGSEAARLPVPGGDLPEVLNSDQLLALTEVPKSMVIVGAGAVGVEFAAVFRAFGCEVTLVEMLPAILPNLDSDIVKRMGLVLRKQGIKMLTAAKVINIEQTGGILSVAVETGKGIQAIEAVKVLAAAGRSPSVNGLGLEKAGIAFSRRGIAVNDRMETNVPGIYAIGDVTGQFMWAHAASAGGMLAAENALGADQPVDFTATPGCIYTSPEIASVGLTEEEAKAQNREIKVSRFNFAANGKAVSMGETDGLVKMIADSATGKLLGLHILGAHASDLIMEGTLAIRNGLTAAQISQTIHPHPSLAECIIECAHGIGGPMIHQVKLSKER